jgi:hypothetical protein
MRAAGATVGPMRSSTAERVVRLPHLATIDRLPTEVRTCGLVVARTGESGGADVVGTLRAHVAGVTWRYGRRSGTGRYEVTRASDGACTLAVVLDGLATASAHAVVEAARRAVLAAAPQAPVVVAGSATVARPTARPA